MRKTRRPAGQRLSRKAFHCSVVGRRLGRTNRGARFREKSGPGAKKGGASFWDHNGSHAPCPHEGGSRNMAPHFCRRGGFGMRPGGAPELGPGPPSGGLPPQLPGRQPGARLHAPESHAPPASPAPGPLSPRPARRRWWGREIGRGHSRLASALPLAPQARGRRRQAAALVHAPRPCMQGVLLTKRPRSP
jgi:hypothetical protein